MQKEEAEDIKCPNGLEIIPEDIVEYTEDGILISSTEELPFTDCKATGTYTKYVAAAYKLGVTNGTSDTTFAPEQIITREQLATKEQAILISNRIVGTLY